MPYTPPSHRSPASSASASPVASRRSSLQSSPRPSLPRSASYLTKHRRTPSASALSDGSTGTLTPQGTSEDLKGMGTAVPSSVRQSPPPVTDERTMPMGAIISPPDSASSGSDDEEQEPQIRGRKLDKALRDAVSQIPMPRSSSPPRSQLQHQDSTEHLQLRRKDGVHLSFSTSALGDLAKGRKMGHVRSATEPNAGLSKSDDNSISVSEEESDEDLLKKPQMVRKKSGELVRPALRPSSRRRPSSMPGTPIFSKAVHFDSHLEHVRHFLQVDRPLAVSAGSSPIDSYESDTEYPFPGNGKQTARTPPFEWEILTTNFPHDSAARKSSPVRLEKVWLSADQKSLLGSVAVANIAFSKAVTCRFTLDYWKTTSEVAADYSHEIRPRETPLGHDRFTFSIKLADTANLESKTLFLCIRYTVNGQEYWDNNSSSNFQVDFRKKHLPMNGKNNFQGASSRPANGLPRSSRRTSSANVPRPKSMPAGFGDFGDDAKLNFDQPIHEYLGESENSTGGLRLKSKSAGNLASDNLSKDFGSPSGLAFSNRYDFGASLSAAVQAAKDKEASQDKDGLYMKANVRTPKPTLTLPEPATKAKSQSPTGATSPNSTISSSSYEELVNKYCFVRAPEVRPASPIASGARRPSLIHQKLSISLQGLRDGTATQKQNERSSPNMKDGTLSGARFDGAAGGNHHRRSYTTSLGSPNGNAHHAGPAAHHTLQLHGAMSPPSGASTPKDAFRANSTSPSPRPSATARSASPAFVSFDATPSNDLSYHVQQQMMDRFPWSDGHAATAIRG
ncbi:GIP2 Glc7p-interacting [Fusarium tjaetaba]|uniref:GIP2 Glc7p-interacting n=1 Tax=Fusarium tjaetaba TaxID=1567544 RepID=A0A8H5QI73_9HYPO|nr:GIP2 Glc7p-interacting [Fusarium tjaetaba]KAF5615013.1 GIP2 Glc7p-interacting [Fusarium tjaetaba]